MCSSFIFTLNNGICSAEMSQSICQNIGIAVYYSPSTGPQFHKLSQLRLSLYPHEHEEAIHGRSDTRKFIRYIRPSKQPVQITALLHCLFRRFSFGVKDRFTAGRVQEDH